MKKNENKSIEKAGNITAIILVTSITLLVLWFVATHFVQQSRDREFFLDCYEQTQDAKTCFDLMTK